MSLLLSHRIKWNTRTIRRNQTALGTSGLISTSIYRFGIIWNRSCGQIRSEFSPKRDTSIEGWLDTFWAPSLEEIREPTLGSPALPRLR